MDKNQEKKVNNTQEKKKSKIAKFLKIAGITVVSGTGLVCGVNEAQHQYFVNKADGLVLHHGGCHMEEGDHNYVLTDQACEMLNFETTQIERDIAMNGMKAACEDLDKYNSKLNLKLCTTNAELAKEYNIPKVDEIRKQDIPIYISNDRNMTSMGFAHTETDMFTYKANSQSITFKKYYLLAVYRRYSYIPDMTAVSNCVSYPLFFHEACHTLGFGHIDDRNSVMNSIINIYNTDNKVTKEDIAMLDKYNVRFYGAESTLKTSSENLTSSVSTYTKSEELEM